jgi:TolA-binding protein
MAGKNVFCFISGILLFSISVPACLAVDEELYQTNVNVISLIDKGKFAEAAAAIDKMTNDYNDNSDLPWAFYWIAGRYQQYDRFQNAKLIYQQIIQNFPESPWAGKAKIQLSSIDIAILILSQNYIEAKESIDKLIVDFEGNADLPEIVYWNAVRFNMVDRFDEAKQVYQKILDNFPDSSWSRKAKLSIVTSDLSLLILSKNYQQASESLDKMVSDFSGNPDLPEALFWLTKLYERVNRPDDANRVYQLLKLKYPTSIYVKKTTLNDAKAKVLLLIESQDYNNADIAFNKMLADFGASPDLPETLFWIAERYQRADKFENAANIWQQIIKNYPDKSWASKSKFWLSRINCISLIILQNYDGAKAALAQFTADFSNNTDFPEALFWIAERYQRFDRFDTAQQIYQQIIDKYPNSPLSAKSKFWLSRINVLSLIVAQDYDNAKIALAQFTADFANNSDLPEALYWIAERYERQGKTEDTQALCQKIIADYPASQWATKAKAGPPTGNVIVQTISSSTISATNTTTVSVQDSNQVLDPQKAGEQLYQSACESIDAGDMNEVLLVINKFIQDFPESKASAETIYSIGDYCYQKTISPDGYEISDENSIMFWKYAIKIWDPILTKLPASDITPKICYATGLCYYQLGDCNSAINYFQKLNNEFPEYDNICVSLLLTANCYDKMAVSGTISKEDAGEQIRTICRKIISYYPDSQIVVPARQLLRQWENQNSNQ